MNGKKRKSSPQKVKNLNQLMQANGGFDILNATLAHAKGNYKEASRLYELSAQKGCGDAYLQLAKMYYQGQGVKQDKKKAIELATFAANDIGVAEAYSFLGRMYIRETDPQDISKGISLLKKGVMKGYLNDALFLGDIYLGRLGDSFTDYKEAAHIFELAYNKGGLKKSVPYLCDLYHGRYSKDLEDRIKYMKWKDIFDKLSPDDI